MLATLRYDDSLLAEFQSWLFVKSSHCSNSSHGFAFGWGLLRQKEWLHEKF
jgi:hypothetical protein